MDEKQIKRAKSSGYAQSDNVRSNNVNSSFVSLKSILIILALIIVIGLQSRNLVSIRKLDRAISTLGPQLYENMKHLSSENVDAVLNKMEFDSKLKAEHSDVIVSKAHKFEYLRIVSDMLDHVSDTDFNMKNLELLQYFDNPKFQAHLKVVMDIIENNPELIDDHELTLRISDKLKIYPNIVHLDLNTVQKDSEYSTFKVWKKKIDKLISVRSLNDTKMVTKSFKNRYKSKNWVFNLIENRQYEILLIVLSNLQVKNQLMDIFVTLQAKKKLQARFSQMQNILLE